MSVLGWLDVFWAVKLVRSIPVKKANIDYVFRVSSVGTGWCCQTVGGALADLIFLTGRAEGCAHLEQLQLVKSVLLGIVVYDLNCIYCVSCPSMAFTGVMSHPVMGA